VSGDAALDAFHAALLDDDPEALYERAPCGYLTTTPDGTIVKVNQTFLTLTGYSREDLIGTRTFASLLTAGGRIYHETHYAPMLRMQGSARAIALEIIRVNGDRLPVLVNAVLDKAATGAPLAVRTAIFDATERRGYERELLRAKQHAEDSEARALSLARTLQETFIPPAVPQVPGLDVAAAYRPAGSGEEVGGDFYDVFEIANGDWIIIVGDVCGKGAEAAVVTALLRYTARAATVRPVPPSRALQTLNEVLLRHDGDRFATAVLLRLQHDERGWLLTVSCAGHPLPMLIRAGEPPAAFGTPGSLLGVVHEPEFTDSDLLLEAGDALVLYTDGVTEGRRGQDFYGDERLRATIAKPSSTAAALVDGTLSDVMNFQDGIPRDDIAIVALVLPT
jgi:sigma-B regulation protein RsbU (phosphoserine phosphatase)